MPFVTSEGANIYLDMAGEGKPLLLAHGFGMDHRQWDPQWEDFTAGFGAFRIDLRGHGQSATTARGYTYAAMTRDVQRILVQIGMDRREPGYMVAHSLSADAALQAALGEPRAFRALVVAAPVVWGHAWSEDWLSLWRAMRSEQRARGPAAAFERFRADSLFDGVRDRPELMSCIQEMHAACSGAHLADDEADTGPTTLERLSNCKVPVLVLTGGRDRDDFRAMAREVAARTPGAELHEFATSGHLPNLEVAAAFNARVREFFARHA
jgi:pimeloyl-ACP methyl ester carboxylesterase